MSTLEKWWDVIEQSQHQRRSDHENFNANLPEPDAIYNHDGYEFGFWKVDEGLIRYEKHKNGYSSYSHRFILPEELAAMNIAWATEKE